MSGRAGCSGYDTGRGTRETQRRRMYVAQGSCAVPCATPAPRTADDATRRYPAGLGELLTTGCILATI